MKNPWNDISLSDYEKHMSYHTVRQLQALNEMMEFQLNSFPVSEAMILGIAGGNGLDHVNKNKLKKVYGVDINQQYLQEVITRYSGLSNILECLCVDLKTQAALLPQSDLVIADLLIEYIGCECFQSVIHQVKPRFVSCIIQRNDAKEWVSQTKYQHIFSELNQIHYHIEEQSLEIALNSIGYHKINEFVKPLPNRKQLIQTDFEADEKS